MELKEFVSKSIVSIIEVIAEAQNKATEFGGYVNPGGLKRNTAKVKDNATWDERNNNYLQIVDFDIAITADNTERGGAKIKVLSGILGGNLGGEKSNKNTVSSRIKFSVPVLLPCQDIGDSKAKTKSMNINP